MNSKKNYKKAEKIKISTINKIEKIKNFIINH